MAIGNCDCCDRKGVPVSTSFYASVGDTTACYICRGDVADPYGEQEEMADVQIIDAS